MSGRQLHTSAQRCFRRSSPIRRVAGLSWLVLPQMADLHNVQSQNPIQLSNSLDGSTFAVSLQQAGDDGQCIHWQARRSLAASHVKCMVLLDQSVRLPRGQATGRRV